MLATLFASGLVNIAAGGVFMLVGLRFVPRRTSRENQLANQAFSAYWTGVGAYTLVSGTLEVMASMGYAPFPLVLFVRYASLPLLTIGIGSLTFYFLYLFSGRQSWLWPVVGFYSLVLTTTTFYIRDREPVGVRIDAWNTDLAYAAPYESGLFAIILLMLVLPPIVGSLFYLRLRRRLADPADRRRVILVGTSILAWSAAAVLARVASGNDLIELLSRPVLGLAVVGTILLAFRPTASPLGPEDHAARAEQRQRALDERVAQLI